MNTVNGLINVSYKSKVGTQLTLPAIVRDVAFRYIYYACALN